jgi:hypothetical protein
MTARELPPVAVWRNAVRDSELDRTAKIVGFVLSTYMDANGDNAFPRRQTIAAGADIKWLPTVDAAIQRLELAELLEVSRSKGRKPNRYTAILPTGRLNRTVDSEVAPDRSTSSPVRSDLVQQGGSTAPESVRKRSMGRADARQQKTHRAGAREYNPRDPRYAEYDRGT